MLIVLTGATGIGKTTVCKKTIGLVRRSGYSCGGVITHRGPNDSRVIEDVQTGQTLPFAAMKQAFSGPRVGAYSFDRRAIDFGIEAINGARGSNVLVVDEIGHLELRSEGFTNAIEAARSGHPPTCVLVVRHQLLSAILPLLLPTPLILETTIASRTFLPRFLATMLISLASAWFRTSRSLEVQFKEPVLDPPHQWSGQSVNQDVVINTVVAQAQWSW